MAGLVFVAAERMNESDCDRDTAAATIISIFNLKTAAAAFATAIYHLSPTPTPLQACLDEKPLIKQAAPFETPSETQLAIIGAQL